MVDPISADSVFHGATHKPVKEIVKVLEKGKAFSYLPSQTRRQWEVVQRHSYPISSLGGMIAIASATMLVGVGVIIGLDRGWGNPLFILNSVVCGGVLVTTLVFDFALYQKGKKIAEHLVSKEEFINLLK